jgi:hypothetical protein
MEKVHSVKIGNSRINSSNPITEIIFGVKSSPSDNKILVTSYDPNNKVNITEESISRRNSHEAEISYKVVDPPRMHVVYTGKGDLGGQAFLRPGQYKTHYNKFGKVQYILPDNFYSAGFFHRISDCDPSTLEMVNFDLLPRNWASLYTNK